MRTRGQSLRHHDVPLQPASDSPEWLLRSFLLFRTLLSFAPPCLSSPNKMSDSAIHSIAGAAGGILAMTAT